MENIIYERDYSQEVMDFRKKTYTQSSADAWDFVVNKEIMKSIGERFRELPHIIIPQNKLLFEECEKKLDRFAFLHAGKIRSVVSYENFDAHIYVELPFFEFHGAERGNCVSRGKCRQVQSSRDLYRHAAAAGVERTRPDLQSRGHRKTQ